MMMPIHCAIGNRLIKWRGCILAYRKNPAASGNCLKPCSCTSPRFYAACMTHLPMTNRFWRLFQRPRLKMHGFRGSGRQRSKKLPQRFVASLRSRCWPITGVKHSVRRRMRKSGWRIKMLSWPCTTLMPIRICLCKWRSLISKRRMRLLKIVGLRPMIRIALLRGCSIFSGRRF